MTAMYTNEKFQYTEKKIIYKAVLIGNLNPFFELFLKSSYLLKNVSIFIFSKKKT